MRPTLCEFAGSDEVLLRLAAAHHSRCLADPEPNHPFSHSDQNPQHVQRLGSHRAEVRDGRMAYSRDIGTQPFVLRLHSGNGDTSDLGKRFLDGREV